MGTTTCNGKHRSAMLLSGMLALAPACQQSDLASANIAGQSGPIDPAANLYDQVIVGASVNGIRDAMNLFLGVNSTVATLAVNSCVPPYGG